MQAQAGSNAPNQPKSGRGRKPGSTNAPGSQRPGPKPKKAVQSRGTAISPIRAAEFAAAPLLSIGTTMPALLPPQLTSENQPASTMLLASISKPSAKKFWEEAIVVEVVKSKISPDLSKKNVLLQTVPQSIQTHIQTAKLPWINKCFVKPAFIWVPELLWPHLYAGEMKHPPCPDCNGNQIHGHGYVWRDAIDEYNSVRVLGRRYKCLDCSAKVKAQQEKNKLKDVGDGVTAKTVDGTFQSWDDDVLANMRPYITSEFPFVFSHRSGIAKTI
ncbi:hypothetical protein HDU80_000579, partial [Chytriomyces hyalinus]